MQKNYSLFVILVMLPIFLNAQNLLSGKITNIDNGLPLPGAHIILLNTQLKAISDNNGYYEIKGLKSGNYKIRVSYVGFDSQTIKISIHNYTTQNISLQPSAIMSEEVIISAIRATDESPTTYTIINKAEIEKENTGKDLPYILKSTPSTVVTSDAGAGIGYTGLRIRGTDLTGINVTLNGIPVNDGESHSVYFVDIPDLASSINDIQVQRGVGTSTNGAASFGASLNIKTNNNNPDPYAEINSSIGSFNTLKNSIMFGSGILKARWNFSCRVSRIVSDGYIDRATSNLKSAYFSGSYFGN